MVDPIIQAAYLFTAIAFIPGVLIAYFVYQSADQKHKLAAAGLVIIPAFAGISYLIMAFGIGTVDLGTISILSSEVTLVGMRYVDWLVTTPILVGLVAYVAQAPRKRILQIMTADAMMIIVGAGAVMADGILQWVLFTVSAGFHVILFFYLYLVLPKYPDTPRETGFFQLLKHHIGLLWLAYPLVWMLAPTGLGYVSFLGASLMYAFLDAIAKVPYVLFFYLRKDIFSVDQQQPTQPVSKQSVPADD